MTIVRLRSCEHWEATHQIPPLRSYGTSDASIMSNASTVQVHVPAFDQVWLFRKADFEVAWESGGSFCESK